MEYVLRVSRKGQVVIPAELRRRFNIKSRVILKVENNEIKIIPFMDLREAFGIDGEGMLKVAKAILADKRRELGLEE